MSPNEWPLSDPKPSWSALQGGAPLYQTSNRKRGGRERFRPKMDYVAFSNCDFVEANSSRNDLTNARDIGIHRLSCLPI